MVQSIGSSGLGSSLIAPNEWVFTIHLMQWLGWCQKVGKECAYPTLSRHEAFAASQSEIESWWCLHPVFFAVSNRWFSIWHGGFLQCAICNHAGLAPGCPTQTQSERHHRCAFSEPACTWFGGRYQQQMPQQLSFFAIALQSHIYMFFFKFEIVY